MKDDILVMSDWDTLAPNSMFYEEDGHVVFDIDPPFDPEEEVWQFNLEEAKKLQLFLRRYIARQEGKT